MNKMMTLKKTLFFGLNRNSRSNNVCLSVHFKVVFLQISGINLRSLQAVFKQSLGRLQGVLKWSSSGHQEAVSRLQVHHMYMSQLRYNWYWYSKTVRSDFNWGGLPAFGHQKLTTTSTTQLLIKYKYENAYPSKLKRNWSVRSKTGGSQIWERRTLSIMNTLLWSFIRSSFI